MQVNYINAHATSTLAGDLAEVNAIRQVFKDPSEIKINATKVLLCSLCVLPPNSRRLYIAFLIQSSVCSP